MSDFHRQINQRIEAFVADIADIARQHAIETLTQALDQRGKLGANGVSPRARGGKRSPAEVQREAGRLMAYVNGHPGQRAEEIASGLGVTTKQLSLPMKKLVASRKVKTRGQKRATRYFPAGQQAAAGKRNSAGKRGARKRGRK